tara:strand:- start:362 stop:535 length:174 start_codon:yes stop_codon:yes gene_type:complete
MMNQNTQYNKEEQAQNHPEKLKHYLDDYFETFDMATYHTDAQACPYDHGKQGSGKLK